MNFVQIRDHNITSHCTTKIIILRPSLQIRGLYGINSKAAISFTLVHIIILFEDIAYNNNQVKMFLDIFLYRSIEFYSCF